METKNYTIPIVIGIVILAIVVFLLWSNNAPANPEPAVVSNSNPTPNSAGSDNPPTPGLDQSSSTTGNNLDTNASSNVAATDTTTSEATSITVALSEQNKSGENGSATIMKAGEKVKVSLTLSGEAKSASQPAHIHMGSCDSLGGVKYQLNSVSKGSSETTVDVSYDKLISELPLAINLHKSAKDIETYVACGDITVAQQ